MIHDEQIQQMLSETHLMLDFTKKTIPNYPPDSLVNALTTLNAYLARSGEIYATAKLYLTEQEEAIKDVMKEEMAKMKATEQRKTINFKTRNTQFLIDLSERLNHNIVHESNNIRRQIQYWTDQMKNLS